MKYLTRILTLLFVFLNSIAFSQELIKEAKLKFDLPNDSWALKDKQFAEGKKIYFYKRESIKDKSGRNVIPNISVITEKVSKNQDVVTYSAFKRMEISFDVDKVFTHEDELIEFQNAIGYKGQYQDQYGKHTIYVIYLINNKKGIQMIFDVTSDLFNELDEEFKKTMKSIQKYE
jgi:hypothetical protein